jgi:hypothetical protein
MQLKIKHILFIFLILLSSLNGKCSVPKIIKSITEIRYKADIINNDIVKTDTFSNSFGYYTKTTFNEKGKLINLIIYDANKNIDLKVEMKYSDKDKLLAVIDFNSENKIVSIDTFYYSNNKIIKEENRLVYLLNYYVEYKYDDDDLLVEKVYRDKNDDMFKREYYKDSLLVKEVKKEYSGNLSQNCYYYNQDNLLIKRIENNITDSTSVKLIETEECKYDIENKLTERIIYNGMYIFTEIYKYDEIGNWIQKIDYNNSDIISITERNIEYY